MADPVPIPLTAATEFIGIWYRPEDTEQVATGRLIFDPAGGLTLEVVSRLPLFRSGEEIPILLGVTSDGRSVTLRNVLRSSSTWNARGGDFVRASVRTAFVGMHATETDLRFHSIEARLSHLNDWCFDSGIDLEQATFPKGGTMTFTAPDELVLAHTRGARVGVTFDFDGEVTPEKTNRPFTVELRQRAWLKIHPKRRWHYDELDELIMKIRWFFGFAVGTQDELLELRAKATITTRRIGPGERRRKHLGTVWILFSPPPLFSPKPTPARDMLFCRADLDHDQIQRPLTRWLSLCRRHSMEPVFGPYYAALATEKAYSDIRFLMFAQVAESYMGRKKPATKFDRRIRLLVEAMPRYLRAAMPTPAAFAKEVTIARNYSTHRDKGSHKLAATGPRLVALSELVKFIYDVAILRELGFSQTEITQLVDRNRRVDGMRRWALRTLKETTPGRTVSR
jgi:hypothetical protein